MKLNNEPFNLIKNGTKTVELRLNDEKRKLFNVITESTGVALTIGVIRFTSPVLPFSSGFNVSTSLIITLL